MTSNWNKLLVLLTAVIAISNGFYSCYARKQFIIMDGTLAETRRSGQQSTEQVWRAIDNLNWAARSMDLSQKQAQKGIDQAIAKLNIQAKAAGNTAVATGRLATDSDQALRESSDAAILDQRPWIGVRGPLVGQVTLEPNKTFNVEILFFNTGKTAAFHATLCKNMQVFPVNLGGPPPSNVPGMQCSNAGAIAPQFPFPLNGDDTPTGYIHNQYDEIMNGTKFLYLWGNMTYHQVHSKPGPYIPFETDFCFVYDRIIKNLTLCEAGNDMR